MRLFLSVELLIRLREFFYGYGFVCARTWMHYFWVGRCLGAKRLRKPHSAAEEEEVIEMRLRGRKSGRQRRRKCPGKC